MQAPKQAALTLREAQKHLTLQKLLEGARTVFQEKGFSRTTVDEIVDAAGTSRGTFYLYFSSKNEILGHVFETDHVEAVLELLREMPEDPTLPALQTWIDKYLELYSQHRVTIRTWIQAGSHEAEVRSASSGQLDRVIQSMSEQVVRYRHAADLPVTEESARTRALLMFILVQEFSYYHVLREYPLDVALGVELMASQWHQAIFGADTGRVTGSHDDG